ncbi:MAG: histidine ammonia-lyase [Chloroflexi bacterium]|nr:histidine ammonia-lyase [Chloroflexota bacterium]
MTTLSLDGNSLTLEQVVTTAYGQPGGPLIALSESAAIRVRRAAGAVNRLLETGQIAYGITTGFGAFKDRIISREHAAELQRNIVVSHAVGAGDPFDIPATRAIMLIRANTLARGHSGIRPPTLQLLIDMLNRGVHPVIPSKGSLGASGDLAPLAHMSLVLIGEGEAEFRGETLPGAEALRHAGLAPVTLAAKEGLALTNGTTVMCALGVLETHRAERLSHAADIIACLSLEALNGTPMAFDERIHQLRPHPRQIDCARYLREALAESEFTRPHDPRNIQDAYTLRCIPQVHGAVREAIAYMRWMMETELNAVTDNPLIFVDENTGDVEVISGGNFHGEPLAIGMDYLNIAMTELGNISERRLMRLLDESSNKNTLPAFLTREGGLNSGFMLLQYTAAALAAENKVLAHPASVDTIPTSANVEDHVSMGCTAALHLREVIGNVEHILSLELMAAAQGIDFRKESVGGSARLGRGTRGAYALVRQHVPFIPRDTVLYPYIAAVKKLVAEGKIAFEP